MARKTFLTSWDRISNRVSTTMLGIQIRKLNQELRGRKILVVGYTGAGKTSLINVQFDPESSLKPGTTKEVAEILAQVVPQGEVLLVDTPGHEQYFELLAGYLDQLTEGALLGVLNVVCFGYNDSQNRQRRYDKPKSYLTGERNTISPRYLEAQRQKEVDHLRKWMLANELLWGKLHWVITAVNKYDLWWEEEEEILAYYGPEGDYGRLLTAPQDGRNSPPIAPTRYHVVPCCGLGKVAPFRGLAPDRVPPPADQIDRVNKELIEVLAKCMKI